MRVTLALTHYNRFDMLCEAVAGILDDVRVPEIVISDDASTDGSWQQLEDKFASVSKVRLFRNATNQDCYQNKAVAVQECLGDWVVLFDSDNVMGSDYLDHLESVLPWREDTAYLPVFAEPHFDYRKYAGIIVTRENVASYMGDVTFRTALNTANHLFHRDRYLSCFDPHTDPHTADSIYMNYRWLAGGNRLHFVPGLRYFHRVHGGSHFQQNNHRTGSFAAQVEEALAGMR